MVVKNMCTCIHVVDVCVRLYQFGVERSSLIDLFLELNGESSREREIRDVHCYEW